MWAFYEWVRDQVARNRPWNELVYDVLTSGVPVAIEVNGQTVFTGPSPFRNWDGVSTGANVDWTQAVITIPAGSLHAGRNELAIANLTPSANFNAPPYVLLAGATLDVPGAGITPLGG